MSEILTQYELLVDNETDTLNRLESCDGIVEMFIEYISRNGTSLDVQTLESILLSVHTVKLDMLTELLHTQLEKAVLAWRIKSKS
jgi:hypothetical protein